MKMRLRLFMMLLSVSMALFGCGASESSQPAKDNPSSPADQSSKENSDEKKEPVAQDVDDMKKEDSVIRILEQNLQYTVNGQEKENTAFLKFNDNQKYSMYVLPEYELSAEEPDKDVLFLSEDDSIFMRIELLPKNSNWDTIEADAKTQLESISKNVKTVSLPDDPFFKEAWAMEVSNGDEMISSYLIKDSELPLKLMIFTKKSKNHLDPFIEMAKTIGK